MGINVEIYFKLKDGSELPEDLAFFNVSEKAVAGTYPNGATHYIYSGMRYYSKHYARGNWPQICAYLMELTACQDVDQVWYKSDCRDFGEGCEPITIKDILDISEFYMNNGNETYQSYFRRENNND